MSDEDLNSNIEFQHACAEVDGIFKTILRDGKCEYRRMIDNTNFVLNKILKIVKGRNVDYIFTI